MTARPEPEERGGVPEPMFGHPVGPWRRHFAWKPRRTFDGLLVWMRPMMRRRIQKHHYLFGGADFWWQYALPGDVRPAPDSDGGADDA